MPEIYEPSDLRIPEPTPTLWTSGSLEHKLRRIYEVASQPLAGETPLKPLSFKQAPVEWLASLAAYTVALPLKMAKEGLREVKAGRLGAEMLKGGPRGEIGEWTPEQYSESIANLSIAGGMVGAGMPGGAPTAGALGIGRKPAMRMMAKGVRDLIKPYKKGSIAREHILELAGPTYRKLMKGLKHVPKEVLEPLAGIETVAYGTKPRKMRGAAGIHEAVQQRITLDIGSSPEEIVNALFHELTHAEQFRPHREFVEALGSIEKRWGRLRSLYELGLEIPKPFKTSAKAGLEAHAYEAGDMFESLVKHLEMSGEKMDLPTFKRTLVEAQFEAETKFGKAPGEKILPQIKEESYTRRRKQRDIWEGYLSHLKSEGKGIESIQKTRLPEFASGKFVKQLDKDVPKSLHKFATTKEMTGQLNYYSDMTMLEKNIAPINKKQAYRPAVRLEDGTVLWHPKARIHADAITMQPGVKKTGSFDYDAIVGSGGIGPDGHYYESTMMGDVAIDMEHRGIRDISDSWA